MFWGEDGDVFFKFSIHVPIKRLGRKNRKHCAWEERFPCRSKRECCSSFLRPLLPSTYWFRLLSFWFSLRHLAFQFLFFYFSVSAFNILIFTFPFFFSVEISLFIFFFTLSSFFSGFSIFSDLFRFTFQFLINYIMKTNTKTWV